MATIDFDKIPRFSELPIKAGAPPDSSWGVFGDNDQLGTINFIAPQKMVGAARLVKKGRAFRLDLPLHLPSPPLRARRRPIRHTVIPLGERGLGRDDELELNTQSSTQWDGLTHVQHPEYGFYNGVKAEDVTGQEGSKLGIERWANRIVTRGVLLDVAKYLDERGTPLNYESSEWITQDILAAVAQAQRIELEPGDILLVRTGWMKHYLNASQEWRNNMTDDNIIMPGLYRGREMVEFLWDNRIAAVAGDNFALEPMPHNPALGSLHHRMLPLLGMPMGELFNFEELAADCVEDGVYECMLTSAPVHVYGGVASPPNALAIK